MSNKPAPRIEFEPDAWERFERAVDTVVKGGPQHRPGADKRKPDEDKKPAPEPTNPNRDD